MTEPAEVIEQHDTESTPEQIEQAKEQGWRDDPEHPKYKTAAQFLEDGQKIAPIAAKQSKKLAAELAETKRMVAEMQGEFMRQRKDGYEQAVRELEQKKAEALENDDVEAYAKADKESKNLEPPVVQDQQNTPNVEFVEWRKHNPWYMDTNNPDNMAMTAYADSILDSTIAEGDFTSNYEVYEAVADKVKKRFEGLREKKKPASQVEGGNNKKPSRKGKQDWRSLPDDIKKEAESRGYIDKFFSGDKEKYAKSYYAEFGE